MAETPKGDTAPQTDATDRVNSEDARTAGAAGPGVDRKPDRTIAGGIGQDSLVTAGAAPDASPLAAAADVGPEDRPTPDRVTAAGSDRLTGDPRPATPPSGAIARTLIPVILLALAIGAGYATYPMWRGEVEPLARQFGIDLPQVASEPTPATPKPTEQAKAAAEPAAAAQPAGAPATAPSPNPGGPKPPAAVADPALAGDVDRLLDRVNALEQRLAALENPAPGPAKADAATVEQLQTRVDGMAQALTAVTDEVAIVREGLAASGGGEGLGPMASQLSERLQGLTDRMEALEKDAGAEPPEPAVKPEDINALQSRLDALAGRLDSAAQANAGTAGKLETGLADLQGRVDQLAKALEDNRNGREKAGAFLLAANQLAAVAATSGGFEAELQALQAAAPPGDAVAQPLATLEARAAGVPSLAVLRDRFAGTAAAAVDASVVGSGEGVLGQALTRVASLVTIRRTATADGDGLDALLVRAETALAAGDLAGAIAAVRKLDGEPGKAVAGWLADAEARAAVDGAVRSVQAAALAGVAGG